MIIPVMFGKKPPSQVGGDADLKQLVDWQTDRMTMDDGENQRITNSHPMPMAKVS